MDEMYEAKRGSQTNSDGPQGEVESPDSRRAYAAPEVTALDLQSVIKGNGSVAADGFTSLQT